MCYVMLVTESIAPKLQRDNLYVHDAVANGDECVTVKVGPGISTWDVSL